MDLSEIWQQMFVKMHIISNEPRSEIRKSLIQILENIIVNHGDIFPESVWQIIFKQILIKMLQDSSTKFNSQQNLPTTEPDVKRKHNTFDDDQVMKQLSDHDVQSWSETCIQYISVIYRTIKKFIQKYMQNGQEYPMIDMIWKIFHEILCSLIRHHPENVNFNKTVS